MRGLRSRVMAVVALATVLPTVVVGALAVRRARRDVEREVVRGNLALVRALGAGLDTTLQDARRMLTLTGAAWADAPDPASGRRLVSRLKRELPLVRRVALLDADGRPVGGDPLEVGDFERHNTYGSYVSEVTFDAAGPRVLVVAQARGRTGELGGYLAAEVDLAFVGQALASARLGPGARIWVVDADGRAIASSDLRTPPGAASLRASHPAVDRALATSGEGSLEEGGVLAVYRNLASYQTTRGVSWAIVLEQPTSEAYALATKTTRDTIVAGAIVLAAALIAGGLLASRLVRPLGRLAARVDAFAASGEAAGGAPPPLPTDAPGEIGLLARRFEEMARRVAERERLQAALARGEKLASVGALAAGVAHEINNPLTTILGYANLLIEDKPEDHPDRDALRLVAEEARRVQATVRTLLDYARADVGPGERGPLDVNALVERTVALVQPTLKKRGVSVALDLGRELPRPAGDARRLEQVLVNLAQNAAHAMEHGGRLALRTAARPDGGVAIEVQDTGPGIPEDLLARIFEPFFTTKGPGMGTGLGLAISRQIVLDHGGRIEVESELGRGSTFRVVLGGGSVG